jgi:hypothetical protein
MRQQTGRSVKTARHLRGGDQHASARNRSERRAIAQRHRRDPMAPSSRCGSVALVARGLVVLMLLSGCGSSRATAPLSAAADGGTGELADAAPDGAPGPERACVGSADAAPFLPSNVPPRVAAALRFAASIDDAARELRGGVFAACRALAVELGCAPPASASSPSDADVAAAAKAALDCLPPALVTAPTTAGFAGGKCEASVGFSLETASECQGDAVCVELGTAAAELLSLCVAPKIAALPSGALAIAVETTFPALELIAHRRGELVTSVFGDHRAAANATLGGVPGRCAAEARARLEDASASAGASIAAAASVIALVPPPP